MGARHRPRCSSNGRGAAPVQSPHGQPRSCRRLQGSQPMPPQVAPSCSAFTSAYGPACAGRPSAIQCRRWCHPAKMSLHCPGRHADEQHSCQLLYNLHATNEVLCVLCFLGSTSDTRELATRRSFVVRCGGGRSFREECVRAVPSPSKRRAMGGCCRLHGRRSPSQWARRQFCDLVSPHGPYPGLLQDMCGKHAPLLASGLTDALAGSADGALTAALVDACAMVAAAAGADFMPDMLADR